MRTLEPLAAGAAGFTLAAYSGLLPTMHEAHHATDHTGIRRGLVIAGALGVGAALVAAGSTGQKAAALPALGVALLLSYAYMRAGAG